jgi:hypothetical protein
MSNSENDEKNMDDNIEELFNFDFADDVLEIDFSNKLKARKRSGVRYVRDDISVAVCKINVFGFGQEVFVEFVELLDISSTGALVSCEKDVLRANDNIMVNLKFSSGRTFKIKSTVVNKSYTTPYQYGLKFLAHHNELGDHLLETQRKLEFR